MFFQQAVHCTAKEGFQGGYSTFRFEIAWLYKMKQLDLSTVERVKVVYSPISSAKHFVLENLIW